MASPEQIRGSDIYPVQPPPLPERDADLDKHLDRQIAKTNEQIQEFQTQRRKNWDEIEARPENKDLQDLDMRATSQRQRDLEDFYQAKINKLELELQFLLKLKRQPKPVKPPSETIQ